MTRALAAAALALRIAAAEEARLDEMRAALVEGDDARALRLLRRHLGLEGEDAASDCAAPGEHRGADRA